VIGDLDGFRLGDPSKRTERRVDFHNLLRRRFRSLFSVPSSSSKWGCSERRGLSAFCTYLTKKHGIFDILGAKAMGVLGGILRQFFVVNCRPSRGQRTASGLVSCRFFNLELKSGFQ